jgi:hypothetical protein
MRRRSRLTTTYVRKKLHNKRMITMRRRPAYSRMHPSTISPVSYHKLH